MVQMDCQFTLEVHYGEHFLNDTGGLKYVRGKMSKSDVDCDLICYFDVVHTGRQLGCSITSVIQYKMPNSTLDDELRVIDSDQSIVDMFSIHKEHKDKTVGIYFEDVMDI
ncbi:hypothetical protein ABFX02_08G092700 [Erythranthe guttata]